MFRLVPLFPSTFIVLACSHSNLTPLMIAASQATDRLEQMPVLSNVFHRNGALREVDSNGWTVLHHLAIRKAPAILQRLLHNPTICHLCIAGSSNSDANSSSSLPQQQKAGYDGNLPKAIQKQM